MDEKKPITLEDLAQTLGDFTQEMRTGFKAAHEYSRQGFETLSAKIDMIDENKPDKGEFETKSEKMIEMINERTFSPDEKTSILDTVKLANDHLGDNVTGKGNITLTREEYDAVAKKVGLPNKFIGGGLKIQGA